MGEINWHKVIEKAQVLNSFWLWFSKRRPAPTALHVPVCSGEEQPSGRNNVRVYLKTRCIQVHRVVMGPTQSCRSGWPT